VIGESGEGRGKEFSGFGNSSGGARPEGAAVLPAQGKRIAALGIGITQKSMSGRSNGPTIHREISEPLARWADLACRRLCPQGVALGWENRGPSPTKPLNSTVLGLGEQRAFGPGTATLRASCVPLCIPTASGDFKPKICATLLVDGTTVTLPSPSDIPWESQPRQGRALVDEGCAIGTDSVQPVARRSGIRCLTEIQGIVRHRMPDLPGCDYTLWTSASDLKNHATIFGRSTTAASA